LSTSDDGAPEGSNGGHHRGAALAADHDLQAAGLRLGLCRVDHLLCQLCEVAWLTSGGLPGVHCEQELVEDPGEVAGVGQHAVDVTVDRLRRG
jgi:hypothetical protein